MTEIQISAKIRIPKIYNRIFQGDIFHDIDVIEGITQEDDKILVHNIHFPLIICLNQDCDLNSDDRDKSKEESNKDCRLLQLLIAPLFNFDVFKQGEHWGDIFQTGKQYNPKKTEGEKIISNDNPRFHYLHFDDSHILPDMVVDFKHFYTVNTNYLYENKDKRICSLSELYREKLNQRFAYFISRIGLP